MSEDLQNLLEKIQRDGIEQAEKTSADIIEKAKQKAREMVDQARTEAQEILQKAAKDAESFTEKSIKALDQAARNTVIAAKSGIIKAIESVIAEETAKAMDDGTVSQILLKVVDAYCTGKSQADILVNSRDVEKLKSFILSKLPEKARSGLQIIGSDSVSRGFKVVIKDKHMEHDLTDESIREALSRVLRPHMAEIMKKA